jgi:hypothetical protein
MTRPIVVVISVLLLWVSTSQGQTLPDQVGLQTPGLAGRGMVNYVFTKRGDLPIYVSVWGAVRLPGRYEIPEGTNLGQLLSLAGGPGFDTRGAIVGIDYRDRQRRGKTHIRVSRSEGGNTSIVLESRIDELLRKNIRNFDLIDGDVVMIDMVQRFNFLDIFMIVSTSSSMVLLLDRIFNIF